MTATRRLYVDGVALASPALRGPIGPLPDATQRPVRPLLNANERRRAPETVRLALDVAQAALYASGHDATTVASVFTSAHGDLPTTDALCRTLADNPRLLSPTRFHHSVHNAASGYWAIGSGSHAASTALSSFEDSFAIGLLEAACQAAADAQPVLLVAYDTQACGPLTSVNRSRGMLAAAVLLSPQPGPASTWAVDWALAQVSVAPPPLRGESARALADNAMAGALPLFEALEARKPARLAWPLGAALALQIDLSPHTSTPSLPHT